MLNNQLYEVQEQLVRIELGDNDPDGAIRDGENSLSFFPNQAWMNYLVGIAWFQMKRIITERWGYIKNATSLESQDKELLSQSYSSLGDCYHDLKDNKSSDDAYEKALSYNADNAYTLKQLCLLLLSVKGRANWKRLQECRNDRMICKPNTASFEDTYAWILFKQKDYAGAKQWIEKALADDKG